MDQIHAHAHNENDKRASGLGAALLQRVHFCKLPTDEPDLSGPNWRRTGNPEVDKKRHEDAVIAIRQWQAKQVH